MFVGRVILDLPPLIGRIASRVSPRLLGSKLATQLGSWGAVIVIAVLVGALAQPARSRLRMERRDLTHERALAKEINRLSTVVARLGASRILACGQPNIPIGYQSAFAWYAGVKVGSLYVSQTYERLHPHPLVNIYPIANGWKAFPSHVDAAHAAACHRMRLTVRS